MRKLGIAPAIGAITEEARRAYHELFQEPLSAAHIQVIHKLFPATQAGSGTAAGSSWR